MKTRILVALSAIALLMAIVPVVLGGTQGSSCSGDQTQVRLYENTIGDTSDNDDSYWKCSNDADLNVGDDHTLPGDCHASPFNHGNWNDCVSSMLIYTPPGTYFCVYGNNNYNRLYPWAAYSSAYNNQRVNAPWNDGISSFKWTTSSNCL